jgi:hypothetical protein
MGLDVYLLSVVLITRRLRVYTVSRPPPRDLPRHAGPPLSLGQGLQPKLQRGDPRWIRPMRLFIFHGPSPSLTDISRTKGPLSSRRRPHSSRGNRHLNMQRYRSRSSPTLTAELGTKGWLIRRYYCKRSRKPSTRDAALGARGEHLPGDEACSGSQALSRPSSRLESSARAQRAA